MGSRKTARQPAAEITAARKPPRAKAIRRSTPSKGNPAPAATSDADPTGTAPAAKRSTKQDLLVELLRAKEGATLTELAAATGWQLHSVRGAISFAIKKKLGLAVTTERVAGRGRVYRIATEGRSRRKRA